MSGPGKEWLREHGLLAEDSTVTCVADGDSPRIVLEDQPKCDPEAPTDGGPDDIELAFSLLPCSYLLVGHCVIVNDLEKPGGKLVSVIVAVDADKIHTKYLNADPSLTQYNRSGVSSRRETVTPCGHFGVEVRINKDGIYWCAPVSESRATYEDGTPRSWQERVFIGTYSARSDVLAVSRAALGPTLGDGGVNDEDAQ